MFDLEPGGKKQRFKTVQLMNMKISFSKKKTKNERIYEGKIENKMVQVYVLMAFISPL